MTIHTGWLSPPVAITGLDHLGTQTPCQLVYAQLLPGIGFDTKVDRSAERAALSGLVVADDSADRRFELCREAAQHEAM